MSKLTIVTFLKSWRGYAQGETAGFDAVRAKDLVDSGVAELLKKGKKGAGGKPAASAGKPSTASTVTDDTQEEQEEEEEDPDADPDQVDDPNAVDDDAKP